MKPHHSCVFMGIHSWFLCFLDWITILFLSFLSHSSICHLFLSSFVLLYWNRLHTSLTDLQTKQSTPLLFFIFQQILFLFIYLNRSESNDARIQRYTPSYRHSQSILYFILLFKDHLLLLSVYSHIRFLSMNYFHNSLTRHRIQIISFLVIAWLP